MATIFEYIDANNLIEAKKLVEHTLDQNVVVNLQELRKRVVAEGFLSKSDEPILREATNKKKSSALKELVKIAQQYGFMHSHSQGTKGGSVHHYANNDHTISIHSNGSDTHYSHHKRQAKDYLHLGHGTTNEELKSQLKKIFPGFKQKKINEEKSNLNNRYNKGQIQEAFFNLDESIHIKKSHRGLFHKDMGKSEDKPITSNDISKGLHSDDPAVRKRANFARNARKWHHEEVGIDEGLSDSLPATKSAKKDPNQSDYVRKSVPSAPNATTSDTTVKMAHATKDTMHEPSQVTKSEKPTVSWGPKPTTEFPKSSMQQVAPVKTASVAKVALDPKVAEKHFSTGLGNRVMSSVHSLHRYEDPQNAGTKVAVGGKTEPHELTQSDKLIDKTGSPKQEHGGHPFHSIVSQNGYKHHETTGSNIFTRHTYKNNEGHAISLTSRHNPSTGATEHSYQSFGKNEHEHIGSFLKRAHDVPQQAEPVKQQAPTSHAVGHELQKYHDMKSRGVLPHDVPHVSKPDTMKHPVRPPTMKKEDMDEYTHKGSGERLKTNVRV